MRAGGCLRRPATIILGLLIAVSVAPGLRSFLAASGVRSESKVLRRSSELGEDSAETPRTAQQGKLMREIMNNSPGLARSAAPKDGDGTGGGVRFLFAPEPSEHVDFALWFGPLPCFQVGTFRYCF
mmetsp:Transcript_89119/g.157914  ORF Transcript_89119/g.157914 Transcript_89119/m.157914 type:complete len:126 (-) Transcript_89119:21-398(-)